MFFLKFTAWPEMMLWPYLILHGWKPYTDIAIAHTPNLIYLLAGFYKIFGVGEIQLKIFTWSLVFATCLIFYFVCKNLYGRKIATLSLIIYLFLYVFYEGNGLWFDLALTPLAILIYYFLHKRKLFIAGIIWGLAFFTKQTAFWFLPVILVTSLALKLKFSKLINFIYGVAIVFVIELGILYAFNIQNDFLNWAINFGIFILPRSSGQINLPNIATIIKSFFFLFGILFIYK
jgi:4-amino-4-deoxy-L-arabinose transferase-like glycosyltransferase